MGVQKVHDHIDRSFDSHLARAREFLRLQSITSNTRKLLETADWLVGLMSQLGLSPDVVPGIRAPLLIARLSARARRTLLVYGMYDVQPIKGQRWSSDPFGAEIRKIGDQDAIIARGACNSKGPLIATLNAVESIMEADTLPVNLVLLIEGEEERGSRSLLKFLKENPNAVVADAALDPFWAEYGTDVSRPTISLGTKGILTVDLVVRGGSWGGPTQWPVHSSTEAWLASPTWRLIQALSTIVTEDQRVAIEGFGDEIEITAGDLALISSLASTFDAREILAIEGAERFKFALPPDRLLKEYFFSPSASLSFVATDTSDVIPPRATARITFRLVPRMTPARCIELLRQHLLRNGFRDIDVRVKDAYPGARVSLEEPVVKAMLRAYEYHGQRPQVLPLSASASPYYLFTDILHIPYVWGGLGRAGRSHSPDEYATVDGLRLFEKSLATFIYEFSSS